MNICEHLSVTAKLFPGKEALVFENRRFTFAELDALSGSAAGLLLKAGVNRGDRVAIMLPNVPAFIVWYYATLRVGAIAVAISTRLTVSEVSFVISDCDAGVVVAISETMNQAKPEFPGCVRQCFVTSEHGDSCNGILMTPGLPETSAGWILTEPDEAALILHTSGTTGFAKGATLSHMNVRSNVHAFNHLCNMQSDDRILLALPLFHCFGQNALLNSAFNVGATVVLQKKFDLSESKRLIADENVTQLYGVPMMFQLFHDSCSATELSSIKYCFSAAATLPIQTSRRWQDKFGKPIYQGYGLTETSPFASYNHRLKFVEGSIGMPIDCVEMKIVDTETGKDCPPGVLGEIVIRGPNVMLGYWNRPDDTAQAIRGGWFYSGDIGRRDEHGFFYIVDRVKDMIAVGGLKVYPAEVERVLLDHPCVSQAAVVGFPDELFGEQVVAFVVPAEPLCHDVDRSKQELQNDSLEANLPPDDRGPDPNDMLTEIFQHAKDNLAHYKIPGRIAFIDDLPRNPSGKVLKTRLRETDLQGLRWHSSSDRRRNVDPDPEAASPTAQLTQPRLRRELRQAHVTRGQDIANAFVQNLVQRITGSDGLPDPESRFLDVGLDSLMIVEMSSQIRVEVGTQQEIPATLVFDHPRICDLGEFLFQTLTSSDEEAPSSEAGKSHSNSRGGLKLQNEIMGMTEQQALEELMKEIET